MRDSVLITINEAYADHSDNDRRSMATKDIEEGLERDRKRFEGHDKRADKCQCQDRGIGG